MNATKKPDPRITPLPQETTPELAGAFQTYVKVLGFVPNSVLIMQRKPKIVQALSQLAAAIWDPASEVPVGFKRMLAHVASRAHGCHY
jgi:predicted O-linked N-acetylglucosamine transferase (SPINDLY family)